MRILLIPALGLLVALTGCTTSTPSTAKATATATAKPGTARSTSTADAENDNAATPAEEDSQAAQTAAGNPAAAAADRKDSTPIIRQAAKPVVSDGAAGVPPVLLSSGHAKLCKVNVGEIIPTIELPQATGGAATLDSLAGARATVVLFWANDRWMSAMALQDLARIAVPDGVAIVGIAVNVSADAAQTRLAAAGARFPQLIDAEGTAFAQVGELALPRIYVLDAQRQIAWFDIEYSEATYRELQQTLATLTGDYSTN
jgi:peroxiredoxin